MKILLNILTTAFIFGSLMFASACHKTNTNASTPKGILYLHVHTDIDTNEVDSAVVAKDSSGRHFQLDIAQFYISGIILTKSDGTSYAINNAYILKNIAQEQYLVDSIPTGNYTTITFSVGVDASRNSMNPSSFASTSALSPQTPSMWFGSTSQGYIFMNLQGYADTTAAQNGPVNQPFSYQLGTSALLRTVTMPIHSPVFTATPNSSMFIHIIADYGKVLRGINFKTQNTATPFTNIGVTTQIANNIPTMFRYEE